MRERGVRVVVDQLVVDQLVAGQFVVDQLVAGQLVVDQLVMDPRLPYPPHSFTLWV